MIDTHSHFLNSSSTKKVLPVATNVPKTPVKQVSNEAKKTKPNGPLENNIYDNVNIELPPPPEEGGDPCSLNDDEPKGTDTDKKEMDSGSKSNDLMEFVNGITKKQWIWAAAIGSGIILLKNSTN